MVHDAISKQVEKATGVNRNADGGLLLKEMENLEAANIINRWFENLQGLS